MSKKIDKIKILKYFFEEPNREFHIREIAKIAKINPTTITSYLNGFVSDRLLLFKKERNLVLYKADDENIIFKESKKHYSILKILNSRLVEYINQELNYPEVIMLFGSYAKAENIKRSDIDLFIISEEKKHLDLKNYEKKLETSIHIFLHTRKEFENMKKVNKELINNILNGIKLSGFLEVFR